MLIKIRDIPDSGLALRLPLGQDLLKDALTSLDGDAVRSHADADVSLSCIGDNIFLQGAISGVVMVPCVRCLVEVRTPVRVPLKMIFTPEGEPVEDKAKPDEDVEFATHDGVRILLEDLLREALILAIPMTQLCRADCKGLCAVCGGDRNARACGCSVEVIDPRLMALKEIKL